MNFNQHSNDEELMQAYQNGSEAAFQIIFKRHSRRVYGFLMNRLRNAPQAEDVFQAIFLKLHQSRRLYDPAFPFSPWLFTICKSVLVDSIRKNHRIHEVTNDEVVARMPAHPDHNLESNLINLSGLNKDQKLAFELRYTEDLSFSEIALRLDTSPTNVRQMISRGMKKLRGIARKGDL